MTIPRILVVDDETTIHNTMRKALKNENFELAFARNGKEALKNLRQSTPDLIFLDLAMPVMDGFEFLDRIAISPDDPYLVVVITGHGDDADVKKSFTKGVNFFLRKPLSMIEVSCLANRCLALKAFEREIKEHRDNLEELVASRTETIKEQLHFQQNLLDSIPTPVFFKDPDLAYLGCNSAFEKHLGLSKEQIIGKSAQDIMEEESAAEHHEQDLKTLKKGKRVYESKVEYKNNDVRHVMVCKAIFKNSDNKVGGLIGTMFDISERKQAEEKLAARSRELEEANSALRVVLNQIGDAKREVEKRVFRNTKDLILPDLDRLKAKCTSKKQKAAIETIKVNLGKLSTHSTRKISQVYLTLSPREIQIADLIHMGRSTKSISLMLNVSESAVEFHRNNLRKKFGLTNRHVNLRTYLMNMD